MKRIKKDIAPCSKWEYDITQEPLILSKQLFDLLLKSKKFSDLLALYSFYYYTAKWQGTNAPRATTAYVSSGIGWGEDKVVAVKKRLKELGLIQDIVRRSSNGTLIGHFIRINLSVTTEGVLPGVVKYPRKYSKVNKRNTKGIFLKNKIPPSIEDVQKYCQERNNIIIPQDFIDFYQAKGWMIGKNKMKDWQAAVRTWESKDKKDMLKYKEPYKTYDGIRYYLQPDGSYRHRTSGELYRP